MELKAFDHYQYGYASFKRVSLHSKRPWTGLILGFSGAYQSFSFKKSHFIFDLLHEIILNITMTLQWPRRRLKSPASRLFTQSFIRAQSKENIKAPRHWPLCGEFTGTGESTAQRASNAENVSIWWRHHMWSDKSICIAPSSTSLANV